MRMVGVYASSSSTSISSTFTLGFRSRDASASVHRYSVPQRIAAVGVSVQVVEGEGGLSE